jgi:hypothetical protein
MEMLNSVLTCISHCSVPVLRTVLTLLYKLWLTKAYMFMFCTSSGYRTTPVRMDVESNPFILPAQTEIGSVIIECGPSPVTQVREQSRMRHGQLSMYTTSSVAKLVVRLKCFKHGNFILSCQHAALIESLAAKLCFWTPYHI